MTREELLAEIGQESGGDASRRLEELEECGFIGRYRVVGAEKRGSIYRLTDNFSLFHMQFVASAQKRNIDNYWISAVTEGAKYAWRGMAFERLCLGHVRQIKERLGISGVAVDVCAWRRKPSGSGVPDVQIDLILDRRDGIVNLCEMKYADGEYVLDKKELDRLIKRKEALRETYGTKKSIHITLVTSNGVHHNKYSGNIQSELTLDDLFRE